MFRGQKAPVVTTFLILNGLVFLAWQFTDTVGFMGEHFLVSYERMIDGRFYSLLSSVFSHNMFIHFFLNMFVLQSFGPFLENYLGSRRFFVLYIFFGLMGSLSHALTSQFFLDQPNLDALGASGAIAGIIMAFALSFPREKILLFGILPMPAIFGAFAFMGLDLWGLYEQSSGSGLSIGHGAHLGGAFAGLFSHFLYLKRLKSKRLFWGY